uniref:Uncharacterized protein n=1 Tax=Trichuris muris TaxID=70415 RepID=A0A5S6Q8B8_TRIMR
MAWTTEHETSRKRQRNEQMLTMKGDAMSRKRGDEITSEERLKTPRADCLLWVSRISICQTSRASVRKFINKNRLAL